MKVTNVEIQEMPVVANQMTKKLIKGLVTTLLVTTVVIAAGPAVIPFIALMFGGSIAYS